MFETGEYVVYGRTGICKVTGVTTMKMDGASGERLYLKAASALFAGLFLFYLQELLIRRHKFFFRYSQWQITDQKRIADFLCGINTKFIQIIWRNEE